MIQLGTQSPSYDLFIANYRPTQIFLTLTNMTCQNLGGLPPVRHGYRCIKLLHCCYHSNTLKYVPICSHCQFKNVTFDY